MVSLVEAPRGYKLWPQADLQFQDGKIKSSIYRSYRIKDSRKY